MFSLEVDGLDGWVPAQPLLRVKDAATGSDLAQLTPGVRVGLTTPAYRLVVPPPWEQVSLAADSGRQ